VANVFHSQLAVSDLDGIFKYIARDNLDAADRLLDRIEERAQLHADSPLIGTPCPELAEGVRSFVIGNYVAFYIPMANGIQLLRVLHSARDIPRVFFDQDPGHSRAARRGFDLDEHIPMFIPPDPMIGFCGQREDRMRHRRHIPLGSRIHQVADKEIRRMPLRKMRRPFLDGRVRGGGHAPDTSIVHPPSQAVSTDHPPARPVSILHTPAETSMVYTPFFDSLPTMFR